MHAPQHWIPLPLYTQVLIAVACGALLGAIFGQEPYLGDLRNEHLGRLGMLVVTLLKLFLHDLWRLGGLYRIGSLVGLALVLMPPAILALRASLRGARRRGTILEY